MGNRKTALTKKILKETLVEELQRSQLQQISITALCEKAGLSRSTFYAHYEDMYELFDEVENDFLTHIVFFSSAMSQSEKLSRIMEYALYVQKNRDTFWALINNGHFLSKFIEQANRYNHAEKKAGHNISLLIVYTVFGTVAMLYKWLESPSLYSPEEIAELILALSDYAEKLE